MHHKDIEIYITQIQSHISYRYRDIYIPHLALKRAAQVRSRVTTNFRLSNLFRLCAGRVMGRGRGRAYAKALTD